MTLTWALLAAAILCEVGATICLRLASAPGRAARRRWYVPVALGYATAFGLLGVVLGRGLGIGVAYGIWSATGVALTALAGRFVFGEALTARMAAGIALIVVGVALVEAGAAH